MRKIALTLIAATAAFASGSALAENHHGNKNHWWNKDVQAFYDCAWAHPVWFDGTITDAVVATAGGENPEFTILLQAVLAAGLEGALAGDDYLTVYAPTDAAFAQVPGPLLDLLLADPQGLLTAVLTYHVVGEKSKRTDPRRVWRRANEVETLNGQSLFLNRGDNGPQVNNSGASCTPVKTWNGVIYVIDSVLLPQFLQPAPEPVAEDSHW